ncbi:transmembrane gamma-carboxyglutamic acid protein 1 isoform X2 [Anarhichas minor]|uniref:transmembrane gamma-carboxyglutamic acid protein 1 isoform X2 n=1 Tax=Anarhichas minor TaxID=65739 RepID=UPI003F73B963
MCPVMKSYAKSGSLWNVSVFSGSDDYQQEEPPSPCWRGMHICKTIRRFWEEYVRESSPSGGLETVVGGVHSLYLIVPLLLVVLIIAAVAVTVWRCHSRKRSQRSPNLGHSHHDHVLSVVSMDHWGRDYHHGDQSELSVHSSPAYPGSELTSGRGSAGDPPPSYEEAVGHSDVQIETEPPPQYEDIVNTSASGGHAK